MLITKTSELGIKTLIYLALNKSSKPISPRIIAEKLNASPTYMQKISNQLVKANILRAHRGSKGGVVLSKPIGEITLLAILEACQGRMLPDYCQETDTPEFTCAFHYTMLKLNDSLIAVLSNCTLADLAAKPCPVEILANNVKCRILNEISSLGDS